MLEKRSLFDYEVNKLNFYACFLDAVFSLESQDIPKGVIQIALCMTANYNHCGQGTDGPFVTCQTNPWSLDNCERLKWLPVFEL